MAGFSPYDANPYGTDPQQDENSGIIGWLRERLRASRMPGTSNTGAMPYYGSADAPTLTKGAPTKTDPGGRIVTQPPAGGIEPVASPAAPVVGAPQPTLEQLTSPDPTPQRAALQFSVGGGGLRDYVPNGATREERMGAQPPAAMGLGPGTAMWGLPANLPRVEPNASGGGFSPSQSWDTLGEEQKMALGYGNVVEARQAEAAQAAATKDRDDPTWREREVVNLQEGAQGRLMEKQSELAIAAREAMLREAVRAAGESAVAALASDPIYQRATPDVQAAMRRAAAADAEKEIRTGKENRTSFNVSPDMPRVSIPRTK